METNNQYHLTPSADGVEGIGSKLKAWAAGYVYTLFLAGFATASHTYGSAAADWILSVLENKATVLLATSASGAVNAIATPTFGKIFVVINSSGYTLTVKAAGGSGVAVTNGTIAMVMANAAGTDFVSLTTGTASLSGATIDNSVIGGTTPAAGTFTTLGYEGRPTSSHDYAGAHADWTIGSTDIFARSFTVTDAAGGAANAILPAGYFGIFSVSNTSGQTVTWKYSGSTGVANATAKKQILYADGTEVYSLKADY